MTRIVVGVALGTILIVAAATAQTGATIAGKVVHKASKAGIPGAEVLIVPDSQRMLTDAAGDFRLERIAAGNVSLLVRRLGFRPESVAFPVAANDDLELLVELDAVPQQLDTVTVAEREEVLSRAALHGFYERKKLGFGRFFDSEILEKEQHRGLGEIITSRSTGSRLVRSLLGNSAWIATTRRPGMMLDGRGTVDSSDRNRGADPRACYPDVYLNGGVVYSFGGRSSLFDINSIPTADISAVEFYVGPSQTPLQYNKTSAVCGVLLIWTK